MFDRGTTFNRLLSCLHACFSVADGKALHRPSRRSATRGFHQDYWSPVQGAV